MTVYRRSTGDVVIAVDLEMILRNVGECTDAEIEATAEAFLDRLIGERDDENGIQCDNMLFDFIEEDDA